MSDQKKQQVLTFEKLAQENVLHFSEKQILSYSSIVKIVESLNNHLTSYEAPSSSLSTQKYKFNTPLEWLWLIGFMTSLSEQMMEEVPSWPLTEGSVEKEP